MSSLLTSKDIPIIAMTSYLLILFSITLLCYILFHYPKKRDAKRSEKEVNLPKFSHFHENRKWVYKMFKHKSSVEVKLLPNWPIVGMLPELLKNSHRIHDFATDVLRENGGTFTFVGPWFANMDMLVTCDPSNVHYILSKHFSNFPKGPEYKTIFDVLGDGILNTDSISWEKHRKMAMSLVNQREFQKFAAVTTCNKVENGLVPIFEIFACSGRVVDLQDLFHRLTFDSTCKIMLGHDPGYLWADLPDCPLERAISDIEEAVLYRHILPKYLWKLQKWFKVGKESKLIKGQEALDIFIAQCISSKRISLKTLTTQMVQNKEKDCDLLRGYLESRDDEIFMRDGIMNLVMAGTHTVSSALAWFFWILSKNPLIENKILDEIIAELNLEKIDKIAVFKFADLEEAIKKMVYLHGAICEALRLYPPVPINHKHSLEKDVLPSGDIIEANTRVLLCFSAMGRMEKIWGDDCLEFKPERWVTLQGGIKHEPLSKFTAFNTGPRACLGKNMSLLQMKIVAISVIYNFRISVVEGHRVSPCNSVVYQMKDGLKVRVMKRYM